MHRLVLAAVLRVEQVDDQRSASPCLSQSTFSANSALRLDECGLWHLRGKRGRITTWGDGQGYLLALYERSRKAWTYAKRRLAFAKVTQDADGEGVLRFELPVTEAQASEVRELAGLHRQWSEEARAALSERSKASGFGRGGPLSTPAQIATNGARTSAEPVGGMIEAAE